MDQESYGRENDVHVGVIKLDLNAEMISILLMRNHVLSRTQKLSLLQKCVTPLF